MTMPEEINRLVADRISDLLLTPDLISSENLRKEGVPEEKIKFVGNIMIDTLEANRGKAGLLKINDIIEKNVIKYSKASGKSEIWNLESGINSFAVMTLHRPSNVDKKEILEPIVRFITDEVCAERMVIWTLHPRTRKMLETFGLFDLIFKIQNLILLEPLSYPEMLRLNMDARIMLTDSGGLQEECTILGTPCLTLRWNTERPVTLREHGGASVLVGNNIERIRKEYHSALEKPRTPVRPELWDGKTAERCLRAIFQYQENVE